MPAAAVIPAPIAYIKVVAVKKPVVEFVSSTADPSSGVIQRVVGVFLNLTYGQNWVGYFEKIRVFQAGFLP